MTFGSITFKKTTRLANRKFTPLWLLVSGAALEACGGSGSSGTTNLLPSITAVDAALRTSSFDEGISIGITDFIFDVAATGPEGITFEIESQTDDIGTGNIVDLFEIHTTTGVITFKLDEAPDYERPDGIGAEIDFSFLSNDERNKANTYNIEVVAKANGLTSEIVTYTVTITDQPDAAVLADPNNPNVEPENDIVAPPPASSSTTAALDIPVEEFLKAFDDDDTDPANQITHLSFDFTALPTGVTLQYKDVDSEGAVVVEDISDGTPINISTRGNIVATIADGTGADKIILSYSAAEGLEGQDVIVDDGGVASVASLTFYVNNVPTIVSVDTDVDGATVDSNNAIEIDENTDADVAIFRIRLNDIDGHVLKYTLRGDDATLFTVDADIDDANVAIISFRSSPDFETPEDIAGDNTLAGDNIYKVKIVATDTLTSEVSRDLTVTVKDVAETAVVTVKNTATDAVVTDFDTAISIDENVDILTTDLYTFSGSDEDAGETVKFRLAVEGSIFEIDADSGVLTFASSPDFEAAGAPTYDVGVIAYSVDSNGDKVDQIEVSRTVKIEVTNVDDAPTAVVLLSNIIAENLATEPVDTNEDGTNDANYYLIGTVFVDDEDIPDEFNINPLVVRDVSDGEISDDFEIVNGKLYLTTALDYETKNSYDIIIVANDGDADLEFTTPTTIQITITDVNEKPTDIALSLNTIAENLATVPVDADGDDTTPDVNYYLIGDITVTDPDDLVEFNINPLVVRDVSDGEISDDFEIVNGKLYLTTALDYETKNSYDIIIVANDGDADLEFTTPTTIQITITDVNEKPTDIALSLNTIAENLATEPVDTNEDGTNDANYYLIGTVFVDDEDIPDEFNINPLVVRDVSDGEISDDFEIVNGKLYLTTALDYETKNSYDIIIVANDGDADLEFTTPTTIQITITDVNEKPTDIALSLNTIAENLATVPVDADGDDTTPDVNYYLIGDITVTDPDDLVEFNINPLVVRDVSDGEISDDFEIVNGKLYLTTALDYETKNSYDIIIVANDGDADLEFTTPTTIQITITDVNEKPTDIALSLNTIAENLATVPVDADGDDTTPDVNYYLIGDITVTDPDDLVAFNINPLVVRDVSDGEISDDFEIVNGKLYLTTALDYETKNSYEILIVANDGDADLEFTTPTTIQITITDVNEKPTDIALSLNTIAENLATVPVDADGDDTTPDVNYYLIGDITVTDPDDLVAFNINPLVVRDVSDGEISDDFEIVNGKLYLTTALDYETKNSYEILIVANDGDADLEFTTPTTIQITITDVNEKPTDIALSLNTIAENLATVPVDADGDDTTPDVNYYLIGDITVTDPDDLVAFNINPLVVRDVSDGEISDDFEIVNGKLYLTTALDYETKNSYEILIVANDGDADLEFTTPTTIQITITDVNEKPTDIALSLNTIAENLATVPVDADGDDTTPDVNYYLIGDITVTDPDDLVAFNINPLVVRDVSDGEISDDFEIVNGKLYLTTALDYETKNSYEILIVANDGDADLEFTTPTTIQITITDVNEKPTDIVILDEFNAVTTSIIENQLSEAVDTNGDGNFDANYYLVGTISYTDPDDPDSGLSFTNNTVSIDSTDFYLDTATDKLYLRSQPDFETEPFSYSVTITVQDDGDTTLVSTKMIEITVEDVNEAPEFLGTTRVATINTPIHGPILISKLTDLFKDPDVGQDGVAVDTAFISGKIVRINFKNPDAVADPLTNLELEYNEIIINSGTADVDRFFVIVPGITEIDVRNSGVTAPRLVPYTVQDGVGGESDTLDTAAIAFTNIAIPEITSPVPATSDGQGGLYYSISISEDYADSEDYPDGRPPVFTSVDRFGTDVDTLVTVDATDADGDDTKITYRIDSQVDKFTGTDVNIFIIDSTNGEGTLKIDPNADALFDDPNPNGQAGKEYSITIIAISDGGDSEAIELIVDINYLPEFVVDVKNLGVATSTFNDETISAIDDETILFELASTLRNLEPSTKNYHIYRYIIQSQEDGSGAVVDLFEVQTSSFLTARMTLQTGATLLYDDMNLLANTYTITVVAVGWDPNTGGTFATGIFGDPLDLTLTVSELEVNFPVSNLRYEKELGDAKLDHTYTLLGSNLFSLAIKSGKTVLSYNIDNINDLPVIDSYLLTLEERVAGVDGVDGDLVETLLFTASIVLVGASADVSVDASASYDEVLGEISRPEGDSLVVGDITIKIPVLETDIDETAGLVEYDFIGDNDREFFDINPTTGVITFQVAPNYEAPFKTFDIADGETFAQALVKANTYDITVRAKTSGDSPFYGSIIVRDLVVEVTDVIDLIVDEPDPDIGLLLQDRESSFGVTVSYESSSLDATIQVVAIAGTDDPNNLQKYYFIPAGTIILPVLGDGVFTVTSVLDITNHTAAPVDVTGSGNHPFEISSDGNLVIADLDSALNDNGDATVEGGVQVDDLRQVYLVTITDDTTPVPTSYQFSIKLSRFNVVDLFDTDTTTDITVFENLGTGATADPLYKVPQAAPAGYIYTLSTTFSTPAVVISTPMTFVTPADGLAELIMTPSVAFDIYEPSGAGGSDIFDIVITFTLEKTVVDGGDPNELYTIITERKSLRVEIKDAPIVKPQDTTLGLDFEGLGENSVTSLDLKGVFLPALEVTDGYAEYTVTYAIAPVNPQNLKDIFTITGTDQLSIDSSFDYETTFIPLEHSPGETGYSDGYLKYINTVDIILDLDGTLVGVTEEETATANLKISLGDDTDEIVFVSSSSATIYIFSSPSTDAFYVAKAVKESELSSPSTTYTYAIFDTNDNFVIDSATGAVTIVTLPSPAIVDGHTFTVTATDTTDALLTQEFEVAVSVNNTITQPTNLDPENFIHQGYTDIYAVENEATTSLLYKIYNNTAHTADYALAGDDYLLFDISATGELRFKSSQDYENPADSNADRTYAVTINASLDVNDDTTFTYTQAPISLNIHIVDVDEAPVLDEAEFLFVIGTDDYFSQLGVFTASDDADDVITYSITGDGDDDQLFDISATGELTFKAQQSLAGNLIGQVKASSTGSSGIEQSDIIDFTVKVIDASSLFDGSGGGSSFEASDNNGDIVEFIPVDHWVG